MIMEIKPFSEEISCGIENFEVSRDNAGDVTKEDLEYDPKTDVVKYKGKTIDPARNSCLIDIVTKYLTKGRRDYAIITLESLKAGKLASVGVQEFINAIKASLIPK